MLNSGPVHVTGKMVPQYCQVPHSLILAIPTLATYHAQRKLRGPHLPILELNTLAGEEHTLIGQSVSHVHPGAASRVPLLSASQEYRELARNPHWEPEEGDRKVCWTTMVFYLSIFMVHHPYLA